MDHLNQSLISFSRNARIKLPMPNSKYLISGKSAVPAKVQKRSIWMERHCGASN